MPTSLPPLPSRLNQPETENFPVSASADAAFATLTPTALATDLRMPPPTLPASAAAATSAEPAVAAGPPATELAIESPPWITTA